MQIPVELQDMFSYSIIPLIICVILIMGVICLLVFFRKTKTKSKAINKKEEIKTIPEKNIKNIPAIKERFSKELEQIEYKHDNGMIELRKAYQSISILIRTFIFEVTDIKVQNYSLKEIEKLNMPEIYELIKEFYKPEFSSKSEGDFKASINKARKVIDKWN